jgi:hypothetical protein
VVGAVNSLRAQVVVLTRTVQSIGVATNQKADTANQYLGSLDSRAARRHDAEPPARLNREVRRSS